MRDWLNNKRSYVSPIQIGETMGGGGIGTVVKTGNGGNLKIGDLVYGTLGELN